MASKALNRSAKAAAGLRNGLLSSAKSKKFLPVVASRNIYGSQSRIEDPKKTKAFDYENRVLNYWRDLTDKVSTRLDENSKIVVVEGAPGIGKSDFAKQLADDLGMKYLGEATMEDAIVNKYGESLRDYNEFLTPKNKVFTEIEFVKNPTPEIEGAVDRWLYYTYVEKYFQYFLALRHVFNTGQGCVIEKSVFGNHLMFDACYNAGWIDRTTRSYMYNTKQHNIGFLLRPNLIIYLDAPVDVVQKKIQQKSEHDKNSPVWANTHFLNDLANGYKRGYLREASGHSHVLTYDWTEPGDFEQVIEDIERLEFDDIGTYEEFQSDWRLYHEEMANEYRNHITSNHVLAGISESFTFAHMMAEQKHLALEGDDHKNMEEVCSAIPGQKYAYGYNEHMGDPNPMFAIFEKPSTVQNTKWWSEMDVWDFHYTPEKAAVKPKW